jgi:hypothetical protein
MAFGYIYLMKMGWILAGGGTVCIGWLAVGIPKDGGNNLYLDIEYCGYLFYE